MSTSPQLDTTNLSDDEVRAKARAESRAVDLREKEYTEASQEIEKMFHTVNICCGKIDSSLTELTTVLISLVSLDKRMNSLWASRDLRLSKRLLIPIMIKNVGTAIQQLKYFTKLVRSASSVVQIDVRQALDPKKPKDSVFE